MTTLRNQGFYAEEGTAALLTSPALRAVKSSSGHISFPPQHYGCQLTGDTGESLVEVLLSGRGRLHAQSTVHMHSRPVPPVPFTVVEVVLDDGPLVRGLLATAQTAPLKHGATLVTCLEEVQNEAGETVRDLRFIAEDKANGNGEEN
ncbi:hypothetical protein CLU95_0911 [Variovorax sp. 54]|uniref:hypothetical protein n=1 Tax=Variovorax sp. 54 TaxID=2035212 RepID=UPI000C19BAF4|nr:hypothetical protein [Variovorax sp. 54]PIF73794.1 hypothetical protein CLU95_0911 [Variovorax sp. 54]